MNKSKGSIVDTIAGAYKDAMLCRSRILANARLVKRDPKLIGEEWLLKRIYCRLWHCDMYYDGKCKSGNLVGSPFPTAPCSYPFVYYRPDDRTWLWRFWSDNLNKNGRIYKESLMNLMSLVRVDPSVLDQDERRQVLQWVRKEWPDMMGVVLEYYDMADKGVIHNDDGDGKELKEGEDIMDAVERLSEVVKEALHERRGQDTAAQGRDDSQGP